MVMQRWREGIGRAAIAAMLVIGVAAAAGCGGRVQSGASTPAPPPRPLVLLVHGRGHAAADSAMVRGIWTGALRTGARALTPEPLLGDDDVRLVWYADALDPRSAAGCDTARRAQAAPTEAGVLAGLGGFGRGLLGALLDLIPDSSSSPLQVLAGDIMYFGDPEKRCAAESRVESALARARAEGRPVVVVAHSMGGVVAYRALRGLGAEAQAAPPVRRFVTLGAPLAVPLVRELVIGGSGPLARPPHVASWVNVRDPDDPFAPSLLGVTGVTELSLTGSGDVETAHDAARYLRDRTTAGAVLRAWCDAFAASRRAPAGCAAVPAS